MSNSFHAMTEKKFLFLNRFSCFFIKIVILVLACYIANAHAQVPQRVDKSVWANIIKLQGIATEPGLHSPALYIFFDPNCPYCAKLWSSKVGSRSVSDLPAVWIPVAYLDKSSSGKAVTLLRGARKDWLAANFSGFDYERRSGAILPSAPNSTEQRTLNRALAVWENLGAGSPLMVWRATDGKIFSFIGLPREERLKELLSDVAPSRLENYKQ